ncbi:MAG: non-hydrolyzing UDP-N-acetylglucosamine 2-epimerase [Candidatus Sulfotelmatobacter sp.]
MHILHVVGARPNFMKAAPVMRALAAHSGSAQASLRHTALRQTLVHTGQHYDSAMSEVFLRELEMPEPDCNLEVGSGGHAQQTAAVMLAFEPVLLQRKPDLVLVYGDVNSTVASALVCAKLGVRVGHVEAGLRSRDRSMPEEINRLLTDQLSDLLFTPSADADENLRREGIDPAKIHLVGNVMIDTLVRLLPRAQERFPVGASKPYVLVTLHRPSNVDDLPWLRELLAALAELSSQIDVVFPVHPRTRQRLDGLESLPGAPDPAASGHLRLVDPLPYIEFLALQRRAALVITDSGGIQEETTFLGVPCLTVRENTERPITLTLGTNQLVGKDLHRLRTAAAEIIGKSARRPGAGTQHRCRVPLWDGHAAERIAHIVMRSLSE